VRVSKSACRLKAAFKKEKAALSGVGLRLTGTLIHKIAFFIFPIY
jgi:hypothetical protein